MGIAAIKKNVAKESLGNGASLRNESKKISVLLFGGWKN